MKVAEPVTTLTDYLLVLELILLGLLLLKGGDQARKLWAAGFLAAALAAAAGGTYHGFIQSLSQSSAAGLWKVTIYSIGISAFLMALASILKTTGPQSRTILLTTAVAAFVVYAWLMINRNDFRYVISFYAPAMLLILVLFVLYRQASTPWIAAGILLSFAAAAVQQSNFRAGKHFNHNDFYHLMQMIAMYLLYRAGRFF